MENIAAKTLLKTRMLLEVPRPFDLVSSSKRPLPTIKPFEMEMEPSL
jgi:hypothetical protein